MKKIYVLALVLVLTTVFAVGCSGKETAKSTAGEFVGKFSGEAGSLEFLPEGRAEVNFSTDYIWMIMAGSNNDKIHKYKFMTKSGEIVSYDKAEYVTFYKEEGGMIISNPCKVQKDSIVLYPSSVNETVLDRKAE